MKWIFLTLRVKYFNVQKPSQLNMLSTQMGHRIRVSIWVLQKTTLLRLIKINLLKIQFKELTTKISQNCFDSNLIT